MRLSKSCCVALLALGMSGCAALPSLKTGTSDEALQEVVSNSVLDVPDTWRAVQTRIGDVSVGWIEMLNEPILLQLVEDAQANNKNLRAAAANVEKSRALVRQAGVALGPVIGSSVGANRTFYLDSPLPDGSKFEWGLQASWEADIWGRIKAGKKASIANLQSVEADYLFSQYSIAAAVAEAYFIGLEARLQADVSRNSLETLLDIDRIVNVQYNEGLAMAQDVALSASDVASTRATLFAAEAGYRDALRALQVLIGRYPDTELEISDSFPDVPITPSAGMPSDLLERRPDIIAAERLVAASTYALDQTKVARLPSLNLTASTGGASDELRRMFDVSQIIASIAGDIAYAIYDNGLNEAQIQEAKAEQEQAVALYAQTVLTAFQEVESSLDQSQVTLKRAEALKVSVEQAKRALDIARKRYNENETDLIDVLSIQQRVITAESSYISAQRAKLGEWISLNLALGGSWQQE